ncbi:MAG: GNAT family N-acetyltransferase, partial [Candidatus Delongbacteria bacterium]|nr:GNAT family N-acetyltransferase [Candidatus Delongbacteria bacterium]
NVCELDIETEEEFRRQGLAFAVAHATIREAFRVGYEKIAWGCDASNEGSWKTAEKLGFTLDGVNYLSWLKKKIENEENDKDDSCI